MALQETIQKAAAQPGHSHKLDGYTTALTAEIVKAIPDIYEEIAIAVAKVSAGRLIRGLNAEQQAAVKRLTARAIRQGWTPEELADRLQNRIGLDERGESAVERQREGLVSRGVPKGQARLQSRAYAHRLRSARALLIAQTELALSVNEAKRILWQRWKDEGIIDQYAVRIWHTHPDERRCPVCKPLNGQRASLTGNYHGGHHGPPIHPNCRCWETLERGPVVIAKVTEPVLAEEFKYRHLL